MTPHGRRSGVSHERWLVSYADFITLMFALFVVLFATATADQKKQSQMSASIHSAFRSLGIFQGAASETSNSAAFSDAERAALSMPTERVENTPPPAQVRDDLDRIGRELAQTLSSQVAGHAVSIQMGHDGLVISLHESGFFASGSATPRPATSATLRRIAVSLAHTPYDVRIEGHTDNIPIHTAEFGSNWELSTARATRIAQLLLDAKLIAPDRVAAAGYAQYHPVASNETPAGRAENRRVDLVVLPHSQVNFAAPNPTGNSRAWRRITDGE
jgi:chemotaxis protein MotB